MTVLLMKNIEKHIEDNVLFPPINLKVGEKSITAIYSTLNVRSTILDMLIGKTPIGDGRIYVNGFSISENRKNYFAHMGVCFFEEGLYERLMVKDYFIFFKNLYDSNQQVEQVLRLTQLQEKKNVRIKDLSFSEKKRVQYGRIIIQDPSLFVFEEPDLNVDMETKRVFITITKKLQEEAKSVLVLTGNMESAITVCDQVYRLDEGGLRLIETEPVDQAQADENNKIEETGNEKDLRPIQFNKIPTKVNEKIVLFDPPEIDYIESNDGQANIYIKGEAFPSSLTLTNLEERLQHYGFFRCHRSYIVNLQKVREVITWTRNSYSLILDDKEKSQVPLSKTKMAELKDHLGLK